MTKILVSHPGLQHAHHSAQALYEAGMLQKFVSGIPIRANAGEYGFLPKKLTDQFKIVNVPKAFRSHPFYWQVYMRIVRQCYKGGAHADFLHKVFHQYDRWFAGQVSKYKPDAVIGYENSCAKTFEVAKSLGIKCILDEPSMHYKYADKTVPYQTAGYKEQININKQKEIDLADAIITCSSFAADSFVEHGVAREKLYPMLLGSTLPADIKPQTRNMNEFIFAGAMSERKSIDLLLNIFQRLYQQGSPLTLKIVGGTVDPIWVEKVNAMPNMTYLGAIPQQQLYTEFAKSACLILPSRFDSFGMVVAEANATGTPAIVSTNVGAKEMIEKYPDSGWIVPPEEEALYQIIKDVGGDENKLQAASKAALVASEDFTWAAYRQRFTHTIKDILNC